MSLWLTFLLYSQSSLDILSLVFDNIQLQISIMNWKQLEASKTLTSVL